jgi:amino-acid N-acetyltransferase
MEICHFLEIERDGTIIGCAALYPSERPTLGELACLAVHTAYHKAGRGEALLQAIESRALAAGMEKLVVLTTRTAHWFRERGFLPGDQSHLPARKKALYNYQRNSKVFFKLLK